MEAEERNSSRSQEESESDSEEIFSIRTHDSDVQSLPELTSGLFTPSTQQELKTLETELLESDKRSENIAKLMIDLQTQLAKSKKPPTPPVQNEKPPASNKDEPETPQFIRDFIEKDKNAFINTSKLLESQATKQMKADLSKSFEKILRLERVIEEKNITIDHLENQLQGVREELVDQKQQNEDLRLDFQTLEATLVQTKMRLLESEDRANTLEFQLQGTIDSWKKITSPPGTPKATRV